MKRVVDITERYREELNEINYILNKLENGKYYEKTESRIDGSVATHIFRLRESLVDLITKIEYNQDSMLEKYKKIYKEFPLK